MFTHNFNAVVQNGKDSCKISTSGAHLRINACPRAWTRWATLKTRCRAGVSKKLTKRRVFSRILRRPISPPRRRDNGRRHRQNTSLRVVPRVENRFRAERHGGGEGASLLAVSGSDSASWGCEEPLIVYTQGRSDCRMTPQPEREQSLCIYSPRTSLSLFLDAPLHRTPMFLSHILASHDSQWGSLLNEVFSSMVTAKSAQMRHEIQYVHSMTNKLWCYEEGSFYILGTSVICRSFFHYKCANLSLVYFHLSIYYDLFIAVI